MIARWRFVFFYFILMRNQVGIIESLSQIKWLTVWTTNWKLIFHFIWGGARFWTFMFFYQQAVGVWGNPDWWYWNEKAQFCLFNNFNIYVQPSPRIVTKWSRNLFIISHRLVWKLWCKKSRRKAWGNSRR